MEAHRKQTLGLAVIALLVVLWVLLRHYWSGA
jgi:hypothetical protein